MFATPLPVKPRPTPIGKETPSTADGAARFGVLRRDYASTQSLVFGRALKVQRVVVIEIDICREPALGVIKFCRWLPIIRALSWRVVVVSELVAVSY